MNKLKFTSIFLFLALSIACFSKPAVSDEVGELKEKIKLLESRVQELESQKADSTAISPSAPRHFPADQWDPFAEMDRMQRHMDQMFRSSFGSFNQMSSGMFSNDMFYDQDFQIEEKDDQYVLSIDMTGLNQERTNIDIKNNSVTISGEHSSEEKQENPDGVMQMRSFGTFVKTIPLPTDADTSKAKTEQKDNELIITFPKK